MQANQGGLNLQKMILKKDQLIKEEYNDLEE